MLSNLKNSLERFLHRHTANKLFVTTETSSAPFPSPPTCCSPCAPPAFYLICSTGENVIGHAPKAARCPLTRLCWYGQAGTGVSCLLPQQQEEWNAVARTIFIGRERLCLPAGWVGARTRACVLCVCLCVVCRYWHNWSPPPTLGVVSRTSEKQEGGESAEDGAIIKTGTNHLPH